MYFHACRRAALLRLSYLAYTYSDVVFLSPFDLSFPSRLLGFRFVGVDLHGFSSVLCSTKTCIGCLIVPYRFPIDFPFF